MSGQYASVDFENLIRQREKAASQQYYRTSENERSKVLIIFCLGVCIVASVGIWLDPQARNPISAVPVVYTPPAKPTPINPTPRPDDRLNLNDAITWAVGVAQGPSMGIAAAAAGVNPHQRDSKLFTINCQRCVMAYELRRRGYAVSARPNPDSYSFLGHDGFRGVVLYGSTYGHAPIDRSTLIIRLQSMPDGARGIVDWTHPNQSVGHVINFEKIKGKVIFIDSQLNLIGDAALEPSNYRGYNYARLDNLPIRKDFNWSKVVWAGK